MNERTRRTSAHGERQSRGADEIISPTGSPASGEGREEQAAVRSRHTIVFYGDTEQVSAGFALALDAMDAHANHLIASSQKASRACRRDLTVARRKKASAQHEAGHLQVWQRPAGTSVEHLRERHISPGSQWIAIARRALAAVRRGKSQ